MRKLLISVTLALALLASLIGGPARAAATPQIVDPALDYPVPFADLVSVDLSVTEKRGVSSLEVKFTLALDVIAETRNLMYGYHFLGKVGKCELDVYVNVFPTLTEPAGVSPLVPLAPSAWGASATPEPRSRSRATPSPSPCP